MTEAEQIGAEVRQRVCESNVAALATLSTDEGCEGFPFGSVVPYALDEKGRPLIYISGIAQHTRYLKADPRASMLIRAVAEGDPQAHWRVTLLGPMRRVEESEEIAVCKARYEAQVPASASYTSAHSFDFWRMDVSRVRFIGGFGNIHWVELDTYLKEPGHGGFAQAATAIIQHMNEDHADALVDYCHGLRGITPASARLDAVEAGGFFVRTTDPERLLYFPFGKEIEASQAREAFVDLLREARAAIGKPSRSSD